MSPQEKTVYLISNGDFRESAGIECWPMQSETLQEVQKACEQLGWQSIVAPVYDDKRKHGFITKQTQGAAVFSDIDPEAPVIVVLSCWAYSHHVCGPLQTHKGPILLVANFDGTWPGLVALLNHSGTLDRLCVKHSRLWSDGFTTDQAFMKNLGQWLEQGTVTHSHDHVTEASALKVSGDARRFGERLAADIFQRKRIMGQFDPGCMGMLNAVINPAKLGAIGMPVEYLNQSDLLAEMDMVPDAEAQQYLDWLLDQDAWFDWGPNPDEKLTHGMVTTQMKMYAAAARICERFGCAAIGIPYQLGLVRCCPASDLVEGMLNNSERPNVKSYETGATVAEGKPIPHFNEGDMGSGIPQVLMNEIYQSKGMPPETTLHDVRWGREYQGAFIWVFLISGGAPPAHWDGWGNTKVYRQPKMYFPLGGGTCSGVSKPGTITWARFYEAFGEIGLDCGTGEVVELPEAEVQDRLAKTTPEWPIANVHIPGYGRDELMATHMSNHITVGYGDILHELVALATSLGIPTRVAGDVRKQLT